jgi:hypothetical protein
MKVALGVLAAFGAGAVYSIKKASDLHESINKANEVFGKGVPDIQKWSKTAATGLGMTRNEALDAAANMGLFAQAAGLSGQKVNEFSKGMVHLSSDLASFFNVNPAEAFHDIQSGLAGQARPLRKYGIFLSEARVQLEGLRMGLQKTKGHLTDQQKILVRQSLIMHDSAKAQGDFARTSDGVANKTRILRAQFEDLAANLGTALLPIVQKLMGWFSAFAGVLSQHKELVGVLAIAIAALAAAFVVAKIKAMLLNATLLANPFFLVATAAVIAAYLIIKNWTKVKAFFTAVWSWIKSHWVLLTVILTGPFAAAIIPIVKNFDKVKAVAQAVFDFFKGVWRGVGNLISGPFRAAFNVIVGIFERIWAWIQKILHAPGNLLGKVGGFLGKAGGFLGKAIPHFQQGGVMPHTGLAMLHAGETVIPSGVGGSMAGGDVVLQINGREFARISRDLLLGLKPSRVSLGLA